ncbi:MAG: membrane protein insertase YidC [Ardenticatenaceae bacterium]|nr:membrane protein insertase YidC [Ardenticatenaceae bacterium]
MWDAFVINPMVNALLLLYQFLGRNFVLAITVFTVLVRLVTLPLNLRQQRSSMRMQEMQPQIQAIQKKYKDNPQKMQEEFQRIGYNPAETLSGCLPLLIQFPILIGLYRAILIVLGSTPLALLELTQRVNPGIDLTPLLPISNKFAWLNLGQPDPFYILPILVLGTMFLQQKLLTPAAPKTQNNEDNPAAAMTQSMQYTMPLMFGFFSLSFPAGLSIYFILANIIGIGQGYYMRQATAHERAASEERRLSNVKAVEKDAPAAKTADSAKAADKDSSRSKRKRRSAKK